MLLAGGVAAALAAGGGGGTKSHRTANAQPAETASSAPTTPSGPEALHQALLRTSFPSDLLPAGWSYDQSNWAGGKMTEGPAPFMPAFAGGSANPYHYVGHAFIVFESTAQASRQMAVDYEVFADDASAKRLLAQLAASSGFSQQGDLTCRTPSAGSPTSTDCELQAGNVVIVGSPNEDVSTAQQVADVAAFLTRAQTQLVRVRAGGASPA